MAQGAPGDAETHHFVRCWKGTLGRPREVQIRRAVRRGTNNEGLDWKASESSGVSRGRCESLKFQNYLYEIFSWLRY